MATDTQSPPTSLLPSAVETTTKGVAAGAILLYVIGYLVISIHHSTFGVMQIDPFKTRIISAGGWFTIMTIIPVFTCLEAAGWERKTWVDLSVMTFPFWMACCTFSLFAAILFSNESNSMLSPNLREILGLASVCVILAYPKLAKSEKVWVGLISVATTVLFVVWSIENLYKARMFTFSALILWFFIVGLFSLLELKNRREPRLRDTRWLRTFFGILVAIFVFGRFYFPHIRASWGGGSPVFVRVHTTKESTISPNSDINGLLIDEEEAGIYLKPDHSRNAIFIPRTVVALISFAEPESTSDLH